MILKGKKTILRPIKMSDAPRFVKWLSDPKVNMFTTRKPVTLKEEKEWIGKLPQREKKGEFQFAIDTKEDVHIGSTSLALDKKDKLGSLGILIGDKNYWDSGYGTDTIRTLLEFGFKKMGLHKVILDGGGVYAYNPRAIKVYKRIGFKKEGLSRESVFYKGKFHDSIPMGILAKEWKKKKPNT